VLSDTKREAVFHVPTATFTASLLRPDQSFGEAKSVTVNTTALEALAARQGATPDLLKLDLQGAELAALKGASALMPGVQAVAVEVNFEPRYEGCARFGDVVSFLEGVGFYLHRLYEIHSDDLGRWRFADALFVRR
jgi:hypothetical protein